MPDRAMRADFLRLYDRMIAAAARPAWEANALPDPRADAKPYNVVAHMLLPAVGAALDRYATCRAELDALIQGIALVHFRAERGAYPAALRSLVPDYLPALPPDPFSGKPFRYTLEGDGFAVHSIGINRTDDLGNTAEQQEGADDIVFSLHAPQEAKP